MPGLSKITTPCGATADENEILYISALHQSCLPDIRRNGTISSADISLLLNSKYGIIISQETAKDIALVLCGGKSVEVGSKTTTIKKLKRRIAGLKRREKNRLVKCEEKVSVKEEGLVKEESGDKGLVEEESSDSSKEDSEEQDSEEESEVYFDLVQLVALLLIPNILDLSKSGENDIFEVVFSQLLEPLYDDDEEKLRETGVLDMDTLQKILKAAGDFDTAKNEELMSQMIKMVEGKGHFDAKMFEHCLTSDVIDGFIDNESKGNDGESSEDKQSSTFYDVFGFNWEHMKDAEDSCENIQKKSTLSFVDYPNMSFRSHFVNVLVWIIFLCTVIFWWLGVGKVQLANLTRIKSDGFHYDIARKMISWSLTGACMGTFGVIFILSFGYGNTKNTQTRGRMLVSMLSILLTLGPFFNLMNYRQGIPHNPDIRVSYTNICPPDQIQESSIPFVTDYKCRKMHQFCHNHPELLGKRLPKNPFKFTGEEYQSCFISALKYAQYIWADMLRNGTYSNNTECFSDSDCHYMNYRGVCGFETDEKNLSRKTCCISGVTTFTENGPVCTEQKNGATCSLDNVCESKNCTNNICTPSEDTEFRYLGEQCNEDDDCISNNCFQNKCEIERHVCPSKDSTKMYGENLTAYESAVGMILSNLKIMPTCVTEETFCSNNPFFLAFDPDFCSKTAIPILAQLPAFNVTMLNVKPKTEENKIVKVVDERLNFWETRLKDVKLFVPFLLAGLLSCVLLVVFLYFFFTEETTHGRDHAIKCAAATKTKLLVTNALTLHESPNSNKESEGITMRNYFQHDRDEETIGGLWWILSGIKSGDLYKKNGINMPGRLIVANIAQSIACIALLIIGIIVVNDIRFEIDKFIRTKLPLTQKMIDSMTDEEFYNLSAKRRLTFYLPKTDIWDKIPRGGMIEASFYPAVCVGTLVSCFCTIVLVPSYIHTTLELRTGKIKTFYCKRFSALRKTGDLINTNLANVVFSIIGGFAALVLMVGFVTFLFVWPVSRSFVMGILSLGIGIATSIFLKGRIQGFVRAKNFQALFRKNVAYANVSTIFFECWSLATQILAAVIRIAIVIIRSFISLGRLDVSFIHPDLGNDSKADVFRREILVQEAHCHPYMDRLSGMYLRRLKHGETFGSVPGQVWRSLFVIGLCPWLIRYRVNMTSIDTSTTDKLEEESDV